MKTFILSLVTALLTAQWSFAGEPNFRVWEAFFKAPNPKKYEAVKKHIAVSLSDKAGPYETSVWKEFTTPYKMAKLYKLVAEGNPFAVDLAFDALPIVRDHAHIPEALAESTSEAFDNHPKIILTQIMKRNESCGWASYIGVEVDTYEKNRDITAKKIAVLKNVSSIEFEHTKAVCLSEMEGKLSYYEELLKTGVKP